MGFTHIPRKYTHGFVLNEQELRKILSFCASQIQKKSSIVLTNIEITLKDHSVITTEDINDIFSLENAGIKSVRLIKIKLQSEDKKNVIHMLFEDTNQNHDTWNSIHLDIYGEDRDWAFLTMSDLEDRVARVKFFSFPHWWHDSIWSQIFMGLVTIFIIWLFNQYFNSSIGKAESLRSAHESGAVKDAIEALIFLEEKKENHSAYWYLGFLVIIVLAPFLITKSIGWFSKVAYKPYVFYWGDEITKHDKRMSLIKGFNVVVILGIIVSILGTIIVKALGID